MTPDQIAAMTALATIVSKIGTWPIGSVIALIVLAPWLFMGFFMRGVEKRHEAAVLMYTDNVQLVKNYEKVAQGLQDILVLSTQTMTQVKDRVDNNLYCLLMRKDPKTETQR